MRVVLAGLGADLWCQTIDQPLAQTVVRRFLRDSAIVAMSSDEWLDVRTRLAQGSQGGAHARFHEELLDLLRIIPMSDRTGQPPVDAYLEERALADDEVPLVAVCSDSALEQIAVQRRNALDRVKTRNAIYDQMIRPFASTAAKVRILDPWAAADISRQRDGMSWVIQSLVSDGIREIEILSLRDDDYSQGVDKKALEQLWIRSATPEVTLRLIVADPLGDAHDRQFRFLYEDGARMTPVVTLGRGASVFEHDRLATPPTVGDVSGSQQAAEAREDVIIRSRSRKSVTQFPPPQMTGPLRGPESALGH